MTINYGKGSSGPIEDQMEAFQNAQPGPQETQPDPHEASPEQTVPYTGDPNSTLPNLSAGGVGGQGGGQGHPSPWGTVVSALGHALAHAAGYATQDHQLMAMADQNAAREIQYRMMGPAAAATAEINSLVSQNKLPEAMAAYQKVAQLAAIYPELGKLGERIAGMSQKQQYTTQIRTQALNNFQSMAENETDPVKKQTYLDAWHIASISPPDESPSLALSAAEALAKQGLDVERLRLEGKKVNVVNGRIVITDLTTEKSHSEMIPTKPVFYADMTPGEKVVLPGITTQAEYDRVAGSDDPKDKKAYSQLRSEIDLSRGVRELDPNLALAAGSVGVSMDALAVKGVGGLPAQIKTSLHGAMLDFKAAEENQKLRIVNAMNMEKPVHAAIPGLTGKTIIMKDGTFEQKDPESFLTGTGYVNGYNPKTMALVTTKEAEQIQQGQMTLSVVDAAKRLLPEIYKFRADNPGGNLGQFVTFYMKSHSGSSEDLAALGQLNLDLAGGLTKAVMGGVVRSQKIWTEVKEADGLNWKDSLDTGARKIDLIDQTVRARMRTSAHMGAGVIDPKRQIQGYGPGPGVVSSSGKTFQFTPSNP